MSGFDLAELLPFYLDETDEHIAGLNDALLRLEQDPADAKALQEAFRMFHSIKGASVVMGFEPVNQLTHHLESLFDQLRSKKRTLDRPMLDLTFRCLDELRDYHRDLRAKGQSDVDLSGLTAEVDRRADTPRRQPARGARPPQSSRPRAARRRRPAPPATAAARRGAGRDRVDGRLRAESAAGRHEGPAGAEPAVDQRRGSCRPTRPSEQLDEVDSLTRFTVCLAADCDADELRSLADVEGVAEIRIEPFADRPTARRAGPPRQASPAEPPRHDRTPTSAGSPPVPRSVGRPRPCRQAPSRRRRPRRIATGRPSRPRRRQSRAEGQDRRDDPRRERPARPSDEPGRRAGDHQGPVRRDRPRAGGAVPRLERPRA